MHFTNGLTFFARNKTHITDWFGTKKGLTLALKPIKSKPLSAFYRPIVGLIIVRVNSYLNCCLLSAQFDG